MLLQVPNKWLNGFFRQVQTIFGRYLQQNDLHEKALPSHNYRNKVTSVMAKNKLLWISLSVSVVILAVVFWFLSSKNSAKNSETGGSPMAQAGKLMVIETSYGPIEIDFFPADAPKTVARIQELTEQGFYNGLVFHRVVPGFVIQGGDPRGDGTGGSGKNLPAEFNSKPHEAGTVAMARAMDPNSADSQFYISLGRHPHLDGNYTVFGKVRSGMDAVNKVKQGDKMLKVTLK
jgi:peptidylprolyl isomerase